MKTDSIIALSRRQDWRKVTQFGFFTLFLLAPALNLFRFDLTETQLWVLGYRWSLGIDDLLLHHISPIDAAISIVLRGFVPLALVIGTFLVIAYRYGRVYCGWLCPHFSIIEILNDLMHRACGRYSLWDRSTTPKFGRQSDPSWWITFAIVSVVLAFIWAITLLTYLLPPAQVWGNLIHGELTGNQFRFIAIGTVVFTLEFVLARHLFCRFGCAVGLFQSLVWMANDKGMVVSFARHRAKECSTCDQPRGSACDNVCPMRLHPRNIKRMMFSCVQCGQCLSACEDSQIAQHRNPNLVWTIGVDVVRETIRQRKQEAC